MTSILVIGKNGQIGSQLPASLHSLGNITSVGRTDLELSDADAIRSLIRAIKPGVIINAAAYTAVDKAESEAQLAQQINGVAPGIMAEEARRLGSLLVHYSTDYVFDGMKSSAYVETDATNPLSVYGKTKLAGEQAIQASGAAHYILRTSWVYSESGSNFLNTMLRLGRERPELRIVDDQTGAPTWARSIAAITADILRYAGKRSDNPDYGVYHLTAAGSVTWFGFAQAIFTGAQKHLGSTPPKLTPITTADYPLPAKRPSNSCLDNSKLGATFGIKPEPWLIMLDQCLRSKAAG